MPSAKRRRLAQVNPSIDGVVLGTRSNTAKLLRLHVGAVDSVLPTCALLPFLRVGSFAFADRLGWYLAEGEALPSGAFPRPDGDTVDVFRSARLPAQENCVASVVRASSSYHGRPVFSFVEVDAGDDGVWYAQVLLLFCCVVHGVREGLALVSYLEEKRGARLTPNNRTFRWFSRFPDCVPLARVRRAVLIIAAEEEAALPNPEFVLIDH